MHVRNIGVRRFKSLYDVNVPLSNFALLAGPNGAGKSNFMAAIDFIGETYRYGLEYAVGRAGGISSVAYRRTKRTTAPVTISVEAELGSSDLGERSSSRSLRLNLRKNDIIAFRHSFSIRPSRSIEDSIFSVAEEEIDINVGKPDDLSPLIRIRTQTKSGDRAVEVDFGEARGYEEFRTEFGSRFTREFNYKEYAESSVEPTELLITSGFFLPILREFRTWMSRFQVYRLNPSSCRKPGILLPNASLGRDGENLPGVLARMRRSASLSGAAVRARSAWAVLLDSVAEIFPALEDIKTGVTAAGDLELQFWEREVGRSWSATELSDGTIQYLALLAVMLDHRSPALFIEEPENALHSWMLRKFLDKCRTIDGVQVLLTTHSPVALKSVRPEEVLLAWKSGGRTSIKPLIDVDPDSVRSYEESGVDVFEQYDSGFLRETIPGGE